MKSKITVVRRLTRGKTDWNKVRKLTDREIYAAARSDPDTFIPTKAQWKKARIVMPERKKPVMLRLDGDVLAWFKRGGRGYQTRINAVLRSFVASQRGETLSEFFARSPLRGSGPKIKRRKDWPRGVDLGAKPRKRAA
ncbi:MAG: BrnA antitoxin family protein [Alphaproteobacteria bacterium]|nr:BrnA antitoxin family protein [Alphaproteobacteria bacterium]